LIGHAHWSKRMPMVMAHELISVHQGKYSLIAPWVCACEKTQVDLANI